MQLELLGTLPYIGASNWSHRDVNMKLELDVGIIRSAFRGRKEGADIAPEGLN